MNRKCKCELAEAVKAHARAIHRLATAQEEANRNGLPTISPNHPAGKARVLPFTKK